MSVMGIFRQLLVISLRHRPSSVLKPMNDELPDNNRDHSNQQRKPHLAPSWNLSVRK